MRGLEIAAIERDLRGEVRRPMRGLENSRNMIRYCKSVRRPMRGLEIYNLDAY